MNKVSTGNDATALSLASLNGRVEAVKYLLEHGANPHKVLKDSVTCLLEASRNGHTDCVEILLDYQSPPPTGNAVTKEDDSKAATPSPASKQISKRGPRQTAYKSSAYLPPVKVWLIRYWQVVSARRTANILATR